MVIEAGLVVGYVIAWAVGKARRLAGRLDGEVDAVIDAGMDKLHETVTAKLGAHPALDDLNEEAATDDGEISELTRQQLELAVTAAARKDDAFGQAVTELLTRLQAAEQAANVSVIAGTASTVFTGDAHANASRGGIAFGQVGRDVNLEKGATGGQDPSEPGR